MKTTILMNNEKKTNQEFSMKNTLKEQYWRKFCTCLLLEICLGLPTRAAGTGLSLSTLSHKA